MAKYVVKAKFTAFIDGEWKTYRVGDEVDQATAKEIGLAAKPNIAAQSKTKKSDEE